MNSEKLQNWALLAEIIGGLAILVTLVVLIFEIRGNTNEIRQQQIRNAQTALGEAEFFIMNNSDVYLKSIQSPEELTETELLQMGYLTTRRINVVQQVYQAYQRGLIPAEEWQTWRDSMPSWLGYPFGKAVWQIERETWMILGRHDFVTEIDQALEIIQVTTEEDWLSSIKEILAVQ